MAEIVNLNRARKERDRSEKQDKAAENRIAFGRTKAEKSLAKSKVEAAKRHVDGHRRSTNDQ